MASCPITSWQKMGKKMEIVTNFIFSGYKTTEDGDCSHKWKDACSLEKSYDKPRQLIQKEETSLCWQSPYSQSYGFPVVIYGCESWIIKKVEHQRTDAFKLWCWRRLLRVPWTKGRSNQSILKKINPEYSLEGLLLKLKLQYFDHLIRRSDSLEKTHGGKD